MKTFSQRHGLQPDDAEITIRHDAPDWLRALAKQWAYEAGLSPSQLRDYLCGVLYESPDPQNWSEYPNIDDEVRQLLGKAPWYVIYDFLEWVFSLRASAPGFHRPRIPDPAAEVFAEKVNRAFRLKGVGWQLLNGQIQVRGPEVFEEVVHTAMELAEKSQRSVANNELREALRDLSRRPAPEITGAIQHGMAALECIAKSVTNDPNLTLGEWIKKNRDKIPPPVDVAVEKLWGYASSYGRHVKEDAPAQYEEAELVVGLSSALSVYLLRKY